MRKFIIIIIASIITTSSIAQKVKTSTIEGYCKVPNCTEISLYTIVEGKNVLYSKTKISPDGYYAFKFEPEYEGFYVIGQDNTINMQAPVYLKIGDNANLNYIECYKYEFTKNNTPENIIIGKWAQLNQEVRKKSYHFNISNSNYKDFFPDFEAFIAKVQPFKDAIKTKNSAFNELMKDFVKFDTDNIAINFIRTPRTIHPKAEDMIPYYASIKQDNYFNNNIFKVLNGRRLLTFYPHMVGVNYRDHDTALALYSTNEQKGAYIIDNIISTQKIYDTYVDAMKKYGKYIVTDCQKLIAENKGSELYQSKEGGVASDFTYPDINGKMVSLSDFKGKVVLVDVWATWCGPCMNEVPYLNKLEKELHNNKNIVFMGVSLDEEKDKQKWLNTIKEKDMGGIQLFASGWSKIAKDYKIKGIPRFMIFDKEGNVYTTNAPRPSNPALKVLLEKLAAK